MFIKKNIDNLNDKIDLYNHDPVVMPEFSNPANQSTTAVSPNNYN